MWYSADAVELAPSPEAFGSWLLLPSMHRRRGLSIDTPVSATWLDNASQLADIWSDWWDYKRHRVIAPERSDAHDRASGIALAFSCGVDSFHALLAAKTITPVTVPTPGQWIASLVPTNILRAIVDENFLAVVISAVLFAAAMTRIKPERRASLVNAFPAIADTAGVLVGWLIALLPVAAFSLAFVSGSEKGLTVAGNVGVFILASCAMLIVLTILMYPLAAILGRVSLRAFAAAAAPGQAVAAGTRSSLACLPALLDGAEQELGMRPEVSAFVLPLSVSTFKLNLALTQPFNLLFISAMFGMHLSPAFMLTFTATMLLLSFTTAGIPSGGAFVSLPFYMSLGIPVEAFALFKVADAVPDIFKTILNVTADMTVATIVARFATAGSPASEPLIESNRLATES